MPSSQKGYPKRLKGYLKKEEVFYVLAARKPSRKTKEGTMKKLLKHVKVTGFNKYDDVVDIIETRVKVGNIWFTPKAAVLQMKKKGAVRFVKENVWNTESSNAKSDETTA